MLLTPKFSSLSGVGNVQHTAPRWRLPPVYRHSPDRPPAWDGRQQEAGGKGKGGSDGWGETGQMFLEWDTGVIDVDWNLKGEHSPGASCSAWKTGCFSWGRGSPCLAKLMWRCEALRGSPHLSSVINPCLP